MYRYFQFGELSVSDFDHYFIVGPQKTATTLLAEVLKNIEDIDMPINTKETFFFDKYYQLGMKWYNRQYTGKKNKKLEIAPSYFSSYNAAIRIADSFNNPKVMIIIRDPVDRAISHYFHMKRYGELSADTLIPDTYSASFIDSSRYATYIPMWQRIVGHENVMILDYLDLERDPDRIGWQLGNFFELKSFVADQEVFSRSVYKGQRGPPSPLAPLAQTVSRFFKSHGLYYIVNLARKSPLHRLAYQSWRRNLKAYGQISKADREWLASQLANDVEYVERLRNEIMGDSHTSL